MLNLSPKPPICKNNRLCFRYLPQGTPAHTLCFACYRDLRHEMQRQAKRNSGVQSTRFCLNNSAFVNLVFYLRHKFRISCLGFRISGPRPANWLCFFKLIQIELDLEGTKNHRHKGTQILCGFATLSL